MARAADPIQARSAASRVVATLRDAGHVAYFAGGCVRDELLSLSPTDYDVATDATPDRVTAVFDRTWHVGVAFGVVLVSLDGAKIEVATFRSDGPYSDARRPDVIHFSDAPADARRRDFTINALYLDPLAPPEPPGTVRGRVIDYVGGVADLQAGVIRAVGDPDQRLAEDHLRALRAVRFAARLSFTLDPTTAEAIKRHATELRGVSRERIGEEMRRMLVHPSRAAAATLLQDLGLDAPVLDGPHQAVPLPTLAGLASEGSAEPVAYPVCLAAWALDRAGPDTEAGVAQPARSRRARSKVEGVVGSWRQALCLSNDERDELAAVLSGYATLRQQWPTASEATQKRLVAEAWFSGAFCLIKVRDAALYREMTTKVQELSGSATGIRPEPLVTGDDLVAMGFTPGPQFKRVLDETYDAQLEGRVKTKSEAMELARRLCV